MTSEMDWSHSFCLACDRQTEGSVYCSEACRLADYEDASSSSSLDSSPISQSTFSWSGKLHSGSTSPKKFDVKFTDTLSNETSSSTPLCSSHPPKSSKTTKSAPNSPSSYSSICSTRENRVFPNTETAQISQDSERALRVYANSFDRSRYGRRQSGY
ncbi:hypothetical protein OnM2_080001 [Erysiphe neolycopersici]|uniref:Uncharacterized protein n=1 Tax=Erysiphe neolycopersici TaxID=212602 RepID=A0A420HGQ2_9PEZI|nr:hypothetical protein OnM2_080001 [Erysiphe neolycopersici]